MTGQLCLLLRAFPANTVARSDNEVAADECCVVHVPYCTLKPWTSRFVDSAAWT